MKRISALLLLACIVAVLVLSPVSAGKVPTLYRNDEAWYRDALSPLIMRDGSCYIPVGLCETFDFITVRTPTKDNLLIANRETGRYISADVNGGTAAIDGEIKETTVFREGGDYYISASLACEVLGLDQEVYSVGGETYLRILDGSQSVGIVDLVTKYTNRDDDTEVLTPPVYENDDGKTLYILCEDGDEEGSVYDLLEEYGLPFTVMLSEKADADAVYRAKSHGEYGVISDTDAATLDALNERLKQYSFVRFRAVLTDCGKDDALRLAGHGYAVITPDVTVGDTIYSSDAVDIILDAFGEKDTVIVLLEDTWSGRDTVRKLAELNGEEFTAENIRNR